MNNKVLSDRQNYYGKQSSQPTYFDGPKISWIREIEFGSQIIALKLENSLNYEVYYERVWIFL